MSHPLASPSSSTHIAIIASPLRSCNNFLFFIYFFLSNKSESLYSSHSLTRSLLSDCIIFHIFRWIFLPSPFKYHQNFYVYTLDNMNWVSSDRRMAHWCLSNGLRIFFMFFLFVVCSMMKSFNFQVVNYAIFIIENHNAHGVCS